MRVRQSILGNADSCLRKMQFSLEDSTYHSGIVRAVGTAYHAGLESYYLDQSELGPRRPTEFDVIELGPILTAAHQSLNGEIQRAGDAFVWDEKFPTLQDAIDTIDFMLATYFTEGHQWPSSWKVLGVEQSFQLPFGDHMRIGTMDLVLQDPNDWVYGVDHKTAGRMWDQYKHLPRKNNQAPFYVAALQELYPDAPGHRFVFDVMTYKGKFERRVSDPTPGHVQAVLDKALQVATLYEGMKSAGIDLPANPSSNLCSPRYCDYWTVCPHGQVLDI